MRATVFTCANKHVTKFSPPISDFRTQSKHVEQKMEHINSSIAQTISSDPLRGLINLAHSFNITPKLNASGGPIFFQLLKRKKFDHPVLEEKDCFVDNAINFLQEEPNSMNRRGKNRVNFLKNTSVAKNRQEVIDFDVDIYTFVCELQKRNSVEEKTS